VTRPIFVALANMVPADCSRQHRSRRDPRAPFIKITLPIAAPVHRRGIPGRFSYPNDRRFLDAAALAAARLPVRVGASRTILRAERDAVRQSLALFLMAACSFSPRYLDASCARRALDMSSPGIDRRVIKKRPGPAHRAVRVSS